MLPKILLVEDDQLVRESIEAILVKDGYQVRAVSDGPEALALIPKETFQAVILDINLPSLNGLEVLNQIKNRPGSPPVIILTAEGAVKTAVQAMKSGAADYLVKPCPSKELKTVLKLVVSHPRLVAESVRLAPIISGPDSIGAGLVGESPAMQKVLALIKKVAASEANVFIIGETGTGKDLAARLIHRQSSRQSKPFVKIDCASLPSELLESELFGHERGAFTGATEQFIGKFEQGNGGTVFLDEISNLTMPVQAKLLNIIQDREFTRLKGTHKIKLDIRLISASNKDLHRAIKEGRFREDLFYRLDVVSLTLPPLRERKEDIPLLVDYFLEKFNQLNHQEIKKVEPPALEYLVSYDWPGNVRELANVIEQMVIMVDAATIAPKDLPSKITTYGKDIPCFTLGAVPVSLKDAKKLSERETILNALKTTKGNKKKAAEILQISRVALHKKIKDYQI